MREPCPNSAAHPAVDDAERGERTRRSEIVRTWLVTITPSRVWPASPRRVHISSRGPETSGPRATIGSHDEVYRTSMNDLGRLLDDAARGRFPPADLAVEVLAPPSGRADAVVAFSGHNVIAAAVDPDEVRAHLPNDDPGAPMSPTFLTWLGFRLGSESGALDVVLVATADEAPGAPPLTRRDDADAHDRVQRALRYRSEVEVYSDRERSGVIILGRGLAGRREVSIEVDPERRSGGIGSALARSALSLVSPGEHLFAQVSPGNVASLRAFLHAGYRPICSEVLFLRR